MMSITFVLALLSISAPGATTPEHPARVVILGIDGVSLNVLEPYAAAGVTPHLAKLMREGSRGHLESFWPTRTPQVWTSAVTGKLPCQHGVWDHLSNTWYNPPEVRTTDKRVVTVRDRKSKALWNLLDARGIRTLVVGWMVTWPAEKLEHGIIVAPKELSGDKRQTTIKGSFYRDAKKMVQPASLWSDVERLMVEPHQIEDDDLAPFVKAPPPDSPLFELPYLKRYMYTYKWSLARARSVERLTRELSGRARPDVVLSYFQCPDTMGHRFWIFKESEAAIRQRLADLQLPAGHAAELKKRFGDSLAACYRDVDERIGGILEATRGPETLVLILSDHGFGHCERPHPFKSEPYGGVHLDQGVLIAAGPGIVAGQMIDGLRLIDVAPTVLHFLGQPVADDMRGRVAQHLFSPAGRGKVQRIPTYETRPQLECGYPNGFPPRKGPLRPVAAQMDGKNPYEGSRQVLPGHR
jgi:arylsulfatase A-like enzyme